MPIAILGWGSLIWDPRDLPREGLWERHGPVLPIEFSRVSKDARLTLVIDSVHGANVPTRFVQSPRSLVQDALNDLAIREGTAKQRIGYVDVLSAKSSADEHPKHALACDIIRPWAQNHRLSGVVWTALESNFRSETNRAFSVENAVAYVRGLPRSARDVALHYIRSAPEEVVTPFRTAISQNAFE